MKNSERLSKLTQKWLKITVVSAMVLAISAIALLVTGWIANSQEITYNEVRVSVQEVNEIYVHRRHNSGRKLDVKVVYQGNSYALHGVTMDDRQKYKEALDSDKEIIAYEYNNELFCSVDAINASTVTNALGLIFWGLNNLSRVSFVISIAAWLINRNKYKEAIAEENVHEKI